MTIANILRGKGSQVVSVGPEEDAAAIARTLAQHRIGAVLVRDPQGGVLGIVSERDIVRALAGQQEGISRLRADQLMTRVLHTVTPETPITTALSMVTDRRVRHLPVLDAGGALAGMISIGDLVKARIAEAEQEASDLRNFVTSGG
ncbi:CBS domain-containing protein [Pseudoroseomonas rhizosphaerae]|uniref:CBS domain-containing protein n=1 Tax=Teichococcus rhizosphaerae TaxID=1335062 RepID=A0A2C7AEQ3_9PROT|nr:CBS domain-containing protein [Pseudoroseomonas rhizosphaerae]PHK96143.1 CBS domain-containing protein [Pseudoroseomonas rhizosphaerae]